LPAASFADPSLTRFGDPDKLFELAEAVDVCVAAHRTFGIPPDTSTMAAAKKALTMVCLSSLFRSSALLAASIVAVMPGAMAEDLNDYPTSARAEYVFACMKANGETQELLQKCSCSIDVIASIIPYDRYVTTETILSMSQVTGPIGSEFRTTEQAKLALQDFHRAQAEAEIRCF
jgi:hypothetical protein